MRASNALLQLLREYDVKHVFGLPGETTVNLYRDWHEFQDIVHVLTRDERSSSFMADGYARTSFKPGVCEGPSVGSTHLIPGVAEAYKASVPMIVITTDIPLKYQGRNMLTEIDQTALYKGVTKETITITTGSEIPFVIRRAFRLATTGRLGPVHIRIPSDVFDGEVRENDVYAQKDFTRYPGHRSPAELDKISQAVSLLTKSERPLIVCGQGVLLSQAWNEVIAVAEFLGIPVGTTTAGKGSFPEVHPLSIGVVGARGGTRFSNKVLDDSDLLFYIGSNTDSASTDTWTLPRLENDKKIIHLDVSEAEAGNNYRTDVFLVGDAKATLQAMIGIIQEKLQKKNLSEIPRLQGIMKEAEQYYSSVKDLMESEERPVHPMRFIRRLSEIIDQDHVIVTDPGVSAIYASTFHKVKKPGRSILFNYSLGALGYAVPASIGVRFARPDSCVVALTGDGSFGFCAGELETLSRVGGNVKVILFNNSSFGWIRAAMRFGWMDIGGHEKTRGNMYFATDFKDVDYVKITEGFGLEAYRVETHEELETALKKMFNSDNPAFLEIKSEPEDRLVPPVPSWARKAKDLGLKYVY